MVDKVGGEKVAHGGGSAADANVEAARCLSRGGEGFLRGRIEEVERRAALQLDRRAWMVGQYEHGRVEHGVVAPPTLPFLVGPGPALGAELVAAHDLRPDTGGPVAGVGLVDAACPARPAVNGRVEGTCPERPVEEPGAGVAERRLERLPLARREAVKRHGEIVDSDGAQLAAISSNVTLSRSSSSPVPCCRWEGWSSPSRKIPCSVSTRRVPRFTGCSSTAATVAEMRRPSMVISYTYTIRLSGTMSRKRAAYVIPVPLGRLMWRRSVPPSQKSRAWLPSRTAVTSPNQRALTFRSANAAKTWDGRCG